MNTTFYAKAHKSGNSIVITIPYNLRTVEDIEVGTRLKVTIQKLDNKTEEEEMSGLPQYNSSPEARELWEITGALSEENRLRAGHLYCSECRHYDDPDRPWSCDKSCPNRSHALFMKMLDMEDNWFWFWEYIDVHSLGSKMEVTE